MENETLVTIEEAKKIIAEEQAKIEADKAAKQAKADEAFKKINDILAEAGLEIAVNNQLILVDKKQ